LLKLAIVIALGAAVWYWRREIASIVDTQLSGVREQIARTLQEATRSAERI
jgi:hypothetical protein